MNPLVHETPDQHVVFELTEEDRKRMRQISVVDGHTNWADVVMHKMCVMQMIALLIDRHGQDPKKQKEEFERAYAERVRLRVVERTPRSLLPPIPSQLPDSSVCVSEHITSSMITWNDSIGSQRERNRLKLLVEEIMNTCPVIRTVHEDGFVVDTADTYDREYKRAEEERLSILDAVNFDDESVPFKVKEEAIRKAAAVRKWGPTTAEPQASPTDS